jgi:tRNA 2-selenouridine synthase
MPIHQISIDNFLRLSKELPVFDVRSPGEYLQAHIPGAISIPLFTDEQRKIIGTAYKRESRKIAVEIGINYFSQRMKILPKEVVKEIDQYQNCDKNLQFSLSVQSEEIFDRQSNNQGVLLHCWRGGMRSETVAWLLNLYGYKIYVLEGGYKSFRRWALKQFEKEYRFNILGGYTGSGKTEVLNEMRKNGKTVIDLEGLANHKGSSFGSLGQMAQPTQEMFENLLAIELWKSDGENKFNSTNGDAESKTGKIIWLEDESRHIGSVGFPPMLWQQMRNSPLFVLEIPFTERLNFVVAQYGQFDKELLKTCVINIQKRLGGLETKTAIQFLNEGNVKNCFEILIRYYDKLYTNSFNKRENLQPLLNKIPCESVSNDNAGYFV